MSYADGSLGKSPGKLAKELKELSTDLVAAGATADGNGKLTALPGGAGTGVASDAIFTAKGDLPVGTGVGTAAKLAVGANALALVADSTQATGAKWAAPVPAVHASTHQPGGSDAMAVDAAAATGSLRTLGSGAAQAAAGNDSRLSDSRTPTAHASSHQPGGSDALAVDAAAATGSLRTLGTGSLQATAGNDGRLSDARTPTAHATSHKSGGSDSIALDTLAAATDITTLNSSTSAHGLLPKLDSSATKVLLGDGTWGLLPLLATNVQTASYTLVLGDAGKIVEMNVGSGNTLTVPTNASVAFPVGTTVMVHQYGAGQVTVTAAGGVTIRSPSAKIKTTGQYSSCVLRLRAADEWVLAGDLA